MPNDETIPTEPTPTEPTPAVPLRVEDQEAPDGQPVEPQRDELSPGEDLGRGGVGSVEPNEPA